MRDRKKAVLVVLIILTAAAGILAAFSFFMEKNRRGNEIPAQYVAHLSADSKSLSTEVVNHLSQETGAKNRGISARDDMSGINWCTVPVTIIEIGR